VVADATHFYGCRYVSYLHRPPKRRGRVRRYPNRAPGYRRLITWIEDLQRGKELIEGVATPFRALVVESDYTLPLLTHFAEREHPLGSIDVLTQAEVMSLTASLGHHLAPGVAFDAEFAGRLCVERRDFGEWLGELG